MTLGSNGTLFVGSREAGNVYAIVDRNHRGHADEVITIAHGLNEPNGVAFHDRSLYVAEIDRIFQHDNIESQLKNPPRPQLVYLAFPFGQASRGWKFLAFGPDGMLYSNIGAPW